MKHMHLNLLTVPLNPLHEAHALELINPPHEAHVLELINPPHEEHVLEASAGDTSKSNRNNKIDSTF